MPDHDLDLKGLKCPLPALRTRRALEAAAEGERLIVSCTDPLAGIDIPHLVHQTGNLLEATKQEDGMLVFHIRKTASTTFGEGSE